MTITALEGPLVINKANPQGSVGTGAANQNPDSGPSLIHHSVGILDPRYPFTYYPGGSATQAFYGFLSPEVIAISAVPSTISAVNIAASQSPGAGAITLVSSSAAGITAGVSITRADTGATITGLLAIDTAMAGVPFGQNAAVNIWDPTKAISRNVRLTSGGNDTGITFTVSGYDLYGYPMTETITGANAGVASGAKAFKYISGVTHTGSVATTLTIGTGDVIGLPLLANYFGDIRVVYNNAVVTASTGFTAAVATNPSTATTGDVRGTYALQSASDNSKRLQIFITPSVANISTITGLFGVAQSSASNNGA